MTDTAIRRVLVALDAGAGNKTTLLAAMHLASRFNARLEVLFVEDINLLRLAELPIAREISHTTRSIRPLTRADMEQQLHRQVGRLRRDVETLAQQANLRVEFRVLRGQVASELSLAVEQMDLLILGKNTQQFRRSEKLGRTAESVLLNSKCNVLLMQYGAVIERPVTVLYSGSGASQRALDLAIQLALGDHNHLCVLYPPLLAADLHTLKTAVTQRVQTYPLDTTHAMLTDMTAPAILDALVTGKGRLLVLDVTSALLDSGQLQSLLKRCDVPIVLVH